MPTSDFELRTPDFFSTRIYVFLLTLTLLAGVSRAQTFEGGLYAEHFQLGYRGQEQFGGILHVYVGEKFTLNYQAGIGPQQGGGWYAHTPIGLALGCWMLGNTGDGTVLRTIGVFALLLPEGVGMDIGTGNLTSNISVNPLGFDYLYRRDPNYEEFGRMSGSIVFRLKMNSNFKIPIYLAPQVAGTMIYRSDRDGFSRYGVRVGVEIGYEPSNGGKDK